MTAFREVVCWSEDSVLATTPRDAASLGDGHFQAVHHPMRLQRRALGDRAEGRWVSEDEIVNVLSGPLRPDGYVFVPIIGGSGTGKSHLVRWVRDQTLDTSGWESRYLPKNRTSIRRVVEIVIQGLEGPAIDAAHEALEAAPAHAERDEVLAERLLDELALLVSHLGALRSEGSNDQREQQLRQKLHRELPDVLRDPVVRRRLVAADAVIPRLVGLAMRGRHDGDGLDDDAIRVLEGDLPMTFEEIDKASAGARSLLVQLAGLPNLLQAAVSMINEALPIAVKRVFVSGQIDFVEVFRDVRRALQAENKELVLFIEDLTVLHGIEREFLDAIVEPAVSPEGRLCNLRIVFAVTDGHFEHLDTVRTRCDDAYWLDAPYGEDGVDRDEALSFLGRYLNSSRLTPNSVEQAWIDRQGESWLTNACTGCEHRDVCHETFGATAEGYGLYPLNRAAAGRFIEGLSQRRFDPREVVRGLVNRFLLQGRADMLESTFPSESSFPAEARASEPLPPLLAAELRTRRPIDHERVISTLRYWSDERSPLDLAESVFTAFGIDDLDPHDPALRALVGGSSPRPSQTSRRSRNDPSAPLAVGDRLKAPWRSHYAELAEWAGQGRELSASATNDLRNLVQRAILENLDVGPAAVHLGTEFRSDRFSSKRVGIVGTVTQQSLDRAIIVLDRTETMAAALQGLILSAELDSTDFPEAAQFRRVVADHVERWIDQVGSHLATAPGTAAVSAVEGLLITSMIVGNGGTAKVSSEHLEASLAPPASRPAVALVERTKRWSDLVDKATALAPRLRSTVEAEFGESRGGAGVRALQVSRLLPIIEAFISDPRLETADAALAPLVNAVGPAIEEEWSLLSERARAAVLHVDRDRPWPEQSNRVLSVLVAAQGAGRLRDMEALEFLGALASVIPADAQRSVFQAAELTESRLSSHEKLRLLASGLPDDVALVHAFARRAGLALDGVEADLGDRGSGSGASTDLPDVVEQVLKSTSRFAAAVEGLSR